MGVRIAYILLVHHLPEQANTFIRQLLDYGDCDIYVHIDKKNRRIADDIVKDERVFLSSKYEIRWGSFEIVAAAIELMRQVVRSGKEYTHVYYGSGQDLLVKRGLYEYLGRYPDKVFMDVFSEITDRDRDSARYRVRWSRRLMVREDWHPYRFIRIAMQLLCKFGVVLYPNKVRLEHMRMYWGTTWFIAPAEVIQYICSYLDSHPEYIRFWKDSLAPDLMFFHTIIMNSEYRDKVRDGLMYVNPGKTFGTNNHPISINKKDIELIEDKVCFCARKFDFGDKEMIDYYMKETMKR